MRIMHVLLLLLAAAWCRPVLGGYPVSFAAEAGEGGATLRVALEKGAYIHAGFAVRDASGALFKAAELPAPGVDEFGEEIYTAGFAAFYPGAPAAGLTVSFQCCDARNCFPPLVARVSGDHCEIGEGDLFAPAAAAVPTASAATAATAAPAGETPALPGRERARAYGYLDASEFLSFLETGRAPGEGGSAAGGLGLLGLLGLFVGGFLLNLTPCVLPIIPMTLAVLGVSKGKAGPGRGLLTGCAYGLGMSVTYGGLGAVAIALGGCFGEWHNLWYFKLGLAALFVVLGLAMLDLFVLDWSRFVGRPKALTERRGSLFGAFLLGVLAALLAGACVAPVLVYTLAQGAEIYNGGNWLGLLLPLLLGLGLASPWPFLGAGLSFLPKPGQWMVRVKQAMAVFLILLGCYYAYGAYRLWGGLLGPQEVRENLSERVPGYFYNDSISGALAAARESGRPLVVDLSATWCRACHKMDATTFRDPGVREALTSRYVFLHFVTDEPFESPELGALVLGLKPRGLPAVVILERP